MKVNAFRLKCIGFASLTCYCVAFSGLITDTVVKSILAVLGSVCLPVFALLIDEAYRHTGNLTRLMTRSLIVALLSAFPYRYAFASASNLFFSGSFFSSFFSAALTGFCTIGGLLFYDKMKTKRQRIFCVVFVCALTMLIGMDFAPYALIITYILHILRDRKFFEKAYYIASFVIVIALVSLFFLKFTDYSEFSPDELLRNIGLLGAVFALPLIKKYDGTKGPSNKIITFFSYAYYVLMLSTIVLLKAI